MVDMVWMRRSWVSGLLMLSTAFTLSGCSCSPDSKKSDTGVWDARDVAADLAGDVPPTKDTVSGDSAVLDLLPRAPDAVIPDAPDAAASVVDAPADKAGTINVDAPDAPTPRMDVPADRFDGSSGDLRDTAAIEGLPVGDVDVGEVAPEKSLAIFGGSWTSDGVDGGVSAFKISSGAKGLHAYAQISPDRTGVHVLLADIPNGTGWYFYGTCTAGSANSTTCDTKVNFISIGTGDAAIKIPVYFGGYSSNGVSELADGALDFRAPAGAGLGLDGPDPQESSRVVLTYDSLTVGSTMTVDVLGTAQSGKSVSGRLQGALVSIDGVMATVERIGVSAHIVGLTTAPRP